MYVRLASIRSRIGENMEDRYLFKAKRVYNGGKWVQGYYVKGLDMYDKEVYLIFEPNTMFYSSGETDGWYKVDPTTICQCTGLKDKKVHAEDLNICDTNAFTYLLTYLLIPLYGFISCRKTSRNV